MSKFKMRRSVGVAPDIVIAEFGRLNKELGGVTPVAVLDAARPDDAPLHPAFCWDDSEAAERYRLWQATSLVRAVHIVDDSGEDRGSAFVRVTVEDDEGGGSIYKPVAEVVADEALFSSALRELKLKLSFAAKSIADLQGQASSVGLGKKAKALGQAKQAVGKAAHHLDRVGA